MTNVIEVDSFLQIFDLSQNGRVVVVDCYATWCGPCKRLAPQYEQLAARYADSTNTVVFCKTQCEDTMTRVQVESLPTILYFRNGALVSRLDGCSDVSKIESEVYRLCAA